MLPGNILVAASLAVILIGGAGRVPTNMQLNASVAAYTMFGENAAPSISRTEASAFQNGAGSIVVGTFEYGGQITSTSTGAVSDMQRAGMTWMKIQLRYFTGMAASEASVIISEAHDQGFKILLSIVGNVADLGAGALPYVEGYAAFLGAVAALGPDAIEVWNEPNIAREWPTKWLDGAIYASMLGLAHKAIKTANPNVIVISAAPAPTGAEALFVGTVMNDDRWLRQFVSAGGLNWLDCVGVHYNEGIVPASATSGDPRDDYYTRYFPGMVNTYWSIIRGTRPLCFTELGYLSPEGYGTLPPAFAWGVDTTVEEQASWLTEAVVLSSRSAHVRLLIIWNVDFTAYGDDPAGGFAMIRPGGGCPACDRLAAAQ